MSVHPVIIPKPLEGGSSPSDIPEGWAEITLDHILQTLESGSRPKGGVRGIKDGVPSIGGEHLNENGRFRFEKLKFVPKRFFEKMNRGHIQVGDILVVKDGATTGKVSLVRSDFPYSSAVVNEHVFICRPSEAIHPPFLFYFLFSELGQARILENFRGSAQGGINQSFTSGTTVPVAPLAEQKRIVAKIEELLARVNAARERLVKVPVILKRFRQAVLAAACSGRLTEDWRQVNPDVRTSRQMIGELLTTSKHRGKKVEDLADFGHKLGQGDLPESWDWYSAGIFYQDARYGTSTKCYPEESAGIPVLRVPNIVTGELDLADLKFGKLGSKELSKLTVKPGDLIVCRTNGSLDLIGKVAVIPELPKPYAFASYLIRLRLWEESLLPDYFHICLSSEVGRSFIEEKARSTAGQFNLNLEILASLPIPVPPVLEQREILRRVRELFGLARRIENRLGGATQRANRLTQAILAKAFRGELVFTEAELARRERRSYESASRVLARIQSDVSKQTDRRSKELANTRASH